MLCNKMAVKYSYGLLVLHSIFCCIVYIKLIVVISGRFHYVPVTTEASVVETTKTYVTNLKHILLWSSSNSTPFYLIGTKQTIFYKFNCTFKNCFVTDNRSYLSDIESYDAIIFNGYHINSLKRPKLPQRRALRQKYVFAGTEPVQYHPACEPELDGFFNWTWTYRLDSDLRWGYIAVYDAEGKRVAPQRNMEWPTAMQPVDSQTRAILDGKTKAAAWFVSRCRSLSRREDFAKNLTSELEKLGLSVDMYGACGPLKCPKCESCFELVKKNYYFYFSFENSMSVDYVTEKLMIALDNYAVPIVLGGADYTRFLPPSSYLNGLELGPERLAQEMWDIINNKTRYYDFFRWRNHFQYKHTVIGIDICNICNALNDRYKVGNMSSHQNFREWWNDKWHHLCNKTDSVV